MVKPEHDFPTLHRDTLPADLKLALAEFRNALSLHGSALSRSRYPVFENVRPAHKPLPKPDQGCEYGEVQVGRRARATRSLPAAGGGWSSRSIRKAPRCATFTSRALITTTFNRWCRAPRRSTNPMDQ